MKIPQAYQRLFEKHRHKVVEGGRGSAKSETLGRYTLIRGMEKPRKIVCGREFQSSIKESVYDMLGDFISTYKLDSFYKVLKTEITAVNGSGFSFTGIRHNISSIKSMYDVDIFWGEEAQTFSANSLTILLPTIRAVDSELLFSMNADLEEDPAWQMLVVDPPPDTLHLHVNYDSNPFFPDNLRALMESHKEKNYQMYLNVWEGQPKAATEGAIFARELVAAAERNEKQPDSRITNVPYDPTVPVCTYWDLGKSALTAIWFVQYVGMQWRVLRHYSNHLEDLGHYLKYVQTLPYIYEKHYLPHDGEQKKLGMVLNIKEQAAKVLKNVQIVPRIARKADAIDAAKQVFPLCWFDKELCADGLSDLRHYAYRVTEDGKISNEPEEGTFYRDTADAFMTFAQSCRLPKPIKDPLEQEMENRSRRRTGTGAGKAWWK